VISDGFDGFVRDLHAFQNWPPKFVKLSEYYGKFAFQNWPPKFVKLSEYYGKFESFGKEFRRTNIHSGRDGIHEKNSKRLNSINCTFMQL